ncbi:hypothetical protein BHE74_00052901 [Ensete ventricosum]|nr:hypothetical protein BHE74_00052901 [Ensete ventricosum]
MHLSATISSIVPETHLSAIINSIVPETHLSAIISSIMPKMHLSAIINPIVPETHLSAIISSIMLEMPLSAIISLVVPETHFLATFNRARDASFSHHQLEHVPSMPLGHRQSPQVRGTRVEQLPHNTPQKIKSFTTILYAAIQAPTQPLQQPIDEQYPLTPNSWQRATCQGRRSSRPADSALDDRRLVTCQVLEQ